MKLARFLYEDRTSLGALIGEEVLDLSPVAGARSLQQLIEDWPASRPEIEREIDIGRQRISLAKVKLMAPLDRPGKFLLLAGNYREHIIESGYAAPPPGAITPQFFSKPATAITGPQDEIVIAPRNSAVDWEAELGVVIGQRGRNIRPEEALRYVFGYTIVNDVSERRMHAHMPDRTKRPNDEFFDWLTGKWFDTFAPMGPVIATADEIPNPSQLTITARLNGEQVQHTATSAMIFDVPQLIAYMSEFSTLEPGDVISTGTPAGVGLARGRFLQVGDVIECQIKGIGTLVNGVVSSS